MKYRLLSKEQFEALHEEFATFLASNGIDKAAWDRIKSNDLKQVDTFLEQFSDLVWEDVLNRTQYLEHYAEQTINLFHCEPNQINRIVVQVNNTAYDLRTEEGIEWFINNSNSRFIEYLKGTKNYVNERNLELFKLIEQGAELSDGELFKALGQIIQKD